MSACKEFLLSVTFVVPLSSMAPRRSKRHKKPSSKKAKPEDLEGLPCIEMLT